MRNFVLIISIFFYFSFYGQEYKFGKVSKSELAEKHYPSDTSADAAILYSYRNTYFDFDTNEGFILVDEYHTRIKIYSKEGLKKATKKIKAYYNEKSREKVTGVKGFTYNLEHGRIVKNKLSKDAIFKEKINEHYYEYKFTMPNVKPGSVIEWKYTKRSPFLLLDEVVLQEDIPIKKLKVRLAFPEYFYFVPRTKGYLSIPPIKKEEKKRSIPFTFHETVNAEGGFRSVHGQSELNFVEKIQIIETAHVPAIKKEPYAGNINNYKSGLLYELSHINIPNMPVKKVAFSWKSIVEKLLNETQFGNQLNKSKHFSAELDNILAGSKTPEEKMMAVYNFSKNKIKWNGWRSYLSFKGIAKAYKEGEGNSADVNLNLVAMLRYAGLEADPVLVSTINNGIPSFPSLRAFDYVIALVRIGDGMYLLDATEKYALPNVLPDRILNFRGLVVKANDTPVWLDIFPKNHSITKHIIQSQFTGEGFKGISRKTMTNNTLLNYRKETSGKSKEDLIKWTEQQYDGIEVVNIRLSNLEDLTKNVTETIQFETEMFYEDIGNEIYISPLLFLQKKENPFKSDERKYPVYYNKPWVHSVVVHINIPQGYVVKSIPQGAEFTLPDDLGFYKFDATQSGSSVTIKSDMVINVPVVEAKYYRDLKNFYSKIVAVQKQQIILEKQ